LWIKEVAAVQCRGFAAVDNVGQHLTVGAFERHFRVWLSKQALQKMWSIGGRVHHALFLLT